MAQIVASTLGAIGLGALWTRLGTIWPLIALHAVNDVLQFSAAGGLEAQAVAAHLPLVKIVVSALMALYGAVSLRAEVSERRRTGQPSTLTAGRPVRTARRSSAARG